MNVHPRFSLAALVTILCWGTSFVAARVALAWLTPGGLVTARLALGLVTLAAIRRVLRPGTGLARQDRSRCLLLGVILAVHLLVQNCGLLWTTATHAGWIVGFIPASIALGSTLFLGQRLTRRGWCGIGLGALGVAVVCLSNGMHFDAAKVGDLLQLSSCATWTAFTLLSVDPIRRSGALPVTVWTIGAAAGVTAVLVVAGASGWMDPGAASAWARGAMTGPALAAVVFLGAVCSGAAYGLWNLAIRTIGSPATGAYLYLQPFVTLAAAQVILGEPVRGAGVAGGVVVLCGVWLVSSARRSPRPAR